MLASIALHRSISLFIDFRPETFQFIKEQLESVRTLIRKHQKEKGGMVLFFGKAQAYLYRPTPGGDGIQFNPQGQIVLNDPDNLSHVGECIIRVG